MIQKIKKNTNKFVHVKKKVVNLHAEIERKVYYGRNSNESTSWIEPYATSFG